MTTHQLILSQVFRSCNYQSYLELGVSHGQTLELMSKLTTDYIGVDMIDIRHNKGTNIFVNTTDNFFAQNTRTFDMIFIDACHCIDYVIKDFENSIQCLNHNGLIALHDTDPENESLLPKEFCSDSYKFRELYCDKYEIITLPVDNAGLTLVKRKNIYRFKDAN